MSLLDDAKRLADTEPDINGFCFACQNYYEHYDDCLWLAMPKIVKALEALDEYIDAIEVSGDRVNVPRRVNAYRALRGIVRGDQ